MYPRWLVWMFLALGIYWVAKFLFWELPISLGWVLVTRPDGTIGPTQSDYHSPFQMTLKGIVSVGGLVCAVLAMRILRKGPSQTGP